jgi:hypothetical protein
VTRVHPRSLATQFFLQIGPSERPRMRRDTSHVSFLMWSVLCPRSVVRRGNAAEAALSSCLIRKRPSRPITYPRRRAERARRPLDVADAEDEALDRVAVSAVIRTKRG